MPAARVSLGAAKRKPVLPTRAETCSTTLAPGNSYSMSNKSEISVLLSSGPFSSEPAPNLEGRLLIHKPAQPDAVH